MRAGFRLHLGGSWEPFGVRPDLSAYSKAIANGYPLAAVLGRDSLRDAAQQVFVTGSFWFAAVPMAAALATLEALEAERGIERMARAGAILREGLARQAHAHGLRVTQSGPVQLPFLTFAADVAAGTFDRANVFTGEAARRGVWLHPWHNWFLSAAHTDADVRLRARADGRGVRRRPRPLRTGRGSRGGGGQVTDVKVYDGLTEYVASAEEAERVRRTLYRTDASARATVLPAYRGRLEAADLERFRDRGYLAMEGVLTPAEVAGCAAALDDLARRRPEEVGAQDEPYYQQGGRGPGSRRSSA